MALCNRDKDASEQNYLLQNTFGAVPVSTTAWIGQVPSPGQVLGWNITGRGLSGTPAYQLNIVRWTATGQTTIPVATALTLPVAFGVSGAVIGQTFAANSSLAAVQNGDILAAVSSGANTAVTDLVVSVVIKATQDFKTSCGI